MMSEVFVYHDETYQAGQKNTYGHILFFVPYKLFLDNAIFTLENKFISKIYSLELLYHKIMKKRKDSGITGKFHFKEISGSKWTKYDKAKKEIMNLLVDALRIKKSKFFPHALHCKMGIIFFDSASRQSLKKYHGNEKERRLKYFETILRFLLKGSVHYLYNETHKVKVLKIISDGMPFHRKLDEERILKRLVEEQTNNHLRSYVDLSETVIEQMSSNHKNLAVDSMEYIHANMLQLADMLLGGTVYSCFHDCELSTLNPKTGHRVENKKLIVSQPIREMLMKRHIRGKNFKNSGHYRTFSITYCKIKNGKWFFFEVPPLRNKPKHTKKITDYF